MALTRRGLLAGILAAGFAPAAIGSRVLMPVKVIEAPRIISGLEPMTWTYLQADYAGVVDPAYRERLIDLMERRIAHAQLTFKRQMEASIFYGR